MKPISYTIAFILYAIANIYIIAQIYSSEEPMAMQALFALLTFMILSILYLTLVDLLNEFHYPEPKETKQQENPEQTDAHQEQLKRKYAIND